jgi:uridine phosphorylase
MRELEGGEMVMARGAVAQFGPMLNQMNMAGGGVGSIPISTAIQAAQNDMQQAQMTRAMESANMFLNVRDFARTTRNNTQPRNLARLT